MAVPTYGAVGTASGASTGITPAYPATVNNNDIAIMIVETANQPVTFPAGWTQIDAPGVGTAGALDAISLQAAWRRCDGTEGGTTVSIADAGDHQLARIFTVVGCPTSGDPVANFASSTAGTASTSYSSPGFTTTLSDLLVISAMGRSDDSSITTAFSGWTNADLGSVTEQFEAGTGTGNGGGFGVATGTKAVAGAVGATTATGPSATQANITFALKSTTSSGGGPTNYTLTADAGSFGYTGQDANLTVGRVLAAATGSFGYTGQPANLTVNRVMGASTGTFGYVGQAAVLGANVTMLAATGSFGYTGQAARATLNLSSFPPSGGGGGSGGPKVSAMFYR